MTNGKTVVDNPVDKAGSALDLAPMRKPQTPPLKRLREARGLIGEAARKVRTTKSCVSHWDNHQREPAPKFRRRYAAFLGITIEELGAIIYAESIKPARKGRA